MNYKNASCLFLVVVGEVIVGLVLNMRDVYKVGAQYCFPMILKSCTVWRLNGLLRNECEMITLLKIGTVVVCTVSDYRSTVMPLQLMYNYEYCSKHSNLSKTWGWM